MTGRTPWPSEPGADAITDDAADELERAIAHDALTTTVAGTRPPCVRWPDAGWISDDLAAQLEAAALCAHCPALAPCRAYVDEHPEPSGVWAGTLPPRRGMGRVHHAYHLDQPPIPADLDPGRPARNLTPGERVALAHALAERGTPLRVVARMLGVSRVTAAGYLETDPDAAAREATTLAARIRTAAAAAYLDDAAIPELARLALHAAAGDAPAALGIPSLHGYLEHALGDTAPTTERRQPVALALLAAGLSMRAAGALTATPYGTVGRWARQTQPPTPDREDHHP